MVVDIFPGFNYFAACYVLAVVACLGATGIVRITASVGAPAREPPLFPALNCFSQLVEYTADTLLRIVCRWFGGS